MFWTNPFNCRADCECKSTSPAVRWTLSPVSSFSSLGVMFSPGLSQCSSQALSHQQTSFYVHVREIQPPPCFYIGTVLGLKSISFYSISLFSGFVVSPNDLQVTVFWARQQLLLLPSLDCQLKWMVCVDVFAVIQFMWWFEQNFARC